MYQSFRCVNSHAIAPFLFSFVLLLPVFKSPCINLYFSNDNRYASEVAIAGSHLNSTTGIVSSSGSAVGSSLSPDLLRFFMARLLAVDHDHATGANRDLLCSDCNQMIGFACDDEALLLKAVSYLRRHKKTDNVVPLHSVKGEAS